MREISQNSAKHSIGFHLVWCTKYRHEILKDAVEVECKRIIAETCKANNWLLHAIEIMPDHIHLFVQVSHTDAPNQVVRLLKSTSAVYLFTKFPNLKARKFWGSGLWSRGAYYASVGSVTEEAVKKYIAEQKKA